MIIAAWNTQKIRRITAVFILITVLAVLIGSSPVAAASDGQNSPVPPESAGRSYMVYECDTKQTLFKQNIDMPADSSLLARLMTCILTLENASITDSIMPSANSVSASGRYTLYASSQYTVDTLIQSVVLGGADNSARVLAEHVNPKTEYFVTLMNQKAISLGMANTYFSNVDGSADNLQRTTVYDMCLFWSYAMENPQFRNYASSTALKWGDFMAVNECKMVSATAFPKASLTAGAFTQYDEKNNLGTTMFYIIDNSSENTPSVRLALVLAGTSNEDAYNIGNNLIDNSFKNYKKVALVNKNKGIVSTNIGESELLVIAAETCYCMIPVDIPANAYIENISYNIIRETPPGADPAKNASLGDLVPPIGEGTVIGTANFLLKDGSTHSVSMIAGNSIHSDIKSINIFYKTIQENTDIFILISVLLLCELILVFMIVSSKIRNRNHRKKFRA